MMDDRPFNLADEDAFMRLPEKTRQAIDKWVGDVATQERFSPFVAMLYSSFVFQRIALDNLERLFSKAEAPSGELEEHRLEALRFMFILMRHEAQAPVPPEDLIKATKLSAETIIKTLRELGREKRLAGPDINAGEVFLPGLGEQLRTAGSFVFFRGDSAATRLALSLLAADVGRQRVPMFVVSDDEPFARALLAQGFLNVEVEPLDKWRGAGKDASWLEGKMANRRHAGVTIVPKFLSVMGRRKDSVNKITADRLERLRPALRAAGTVMVGCVPGSSALRDTPNKGVYVHDARLVQTVAGTERDDSNVELEVDGTRFAVPAIESGA